MTIHSDDPFADPEPDHLRRARGRLGGRVTLWTAGDASRRAALTVSSIMIAPGEPGEVMALLDPDSDLADAVARTGRAVVHLLDWRHRDLAEQAAGRLPAPGGVFAQPGHDWVDDSHGPLLVGAAVTIRVTLDGSAPTTDAGWSWLARCRVETIDIDDDGEPLMHRRGRYERPSQPGSSPR